MRASRRSFLRKSALAFPAVSGYWHWGPKRENGPIVISTWDSGPVANTAAWRVLNDGGHALDAVEQAGIAIENEIICCVGLGANPDRDGHVSLDASIMDHKANCGSVVFLERIKHPVSVARKVMEDTPHVILAGEGAQQFALEAGFKLEPDKLSPAAEKAFKDWLEKSEYKPAVNIERQQNKQGSNDIFAPDALDSGKFNHDTMGTIALDSTGNLSGMCTTSGLAFKMRGRVGDSPIIGAGLFVDNEVGAVTATGQGEEILRIAGSHLVIEFMRSGLSPKEACRRAIERIVKRDPARAKEFQAAFIALNKNGEYGAFAVQKGFMFTVTDKNQENKIIDCESYLA